MKKSLCILLPIVILSSLEINSSEDFNISQKYNLMVPKSDMARRSFMGIINDVPITRNELNDDYYNYTLYNYSDYGFWINYKMLDFISHHFDEKMYIKNNLNLLENINSTISSELHRIGEENNKIRSQILTYDFFEKVSEDYADSDNISEFIGNKFYNEVNVDSISSYNFTEKETVIVFGNKGSNNQKVSFFCNENIKMAYIAGFSNETSPRFSGMNQRHPIYISIPDNIAKNLELHTDNRCLMRKKFDNHEEAIDFHSILENPRSRFILHFNIIPKQHKNAFYYLAETTNFGLNKINYNFLEPFYDFDAEPSDFNNVILNIKNEVKENNFFEFGEEFEIQEYLNNLLFYDFGTGKIRIDYSEKKAYIVGNGYKSSYNIEDNRYYYTLTLDKVYSMSNPNMPRAIYFRKLYDNFDLFIDYTYHFRVDLKTINLDKSENIRF